MTPTTDSVSTELLRAAGTYPNGATPLVVATTLPAAQPSLGSLETPVDQKRMTSAQVDTDDGRPAPVEFVHSGWYRRREATAAALERTNQRETRRRRFASCGSGYWILRSLKQPTVYKLCVDRCHDRLCVPCQRARATRIVANLTSHLNAGPYRLITLTLKHRDATLKSELDRLYNAFRRIRQSKPWRAKVTGGIAFVEINRNRDTGQWHAHLHIICEGKYFGVGQLSKLWLQTTGDSTNVDIRLVRDTNQAAHYVTKYATKDTDVNALTHPDAFDEYLTATNGRRLVIPFGTWHKWGLLRKPSTEGWIRYCHANELGRNPHHDADVDRVLLQCIQLAMTDPAATQFDLAHIRPPPPQPTRPPELHLQTELF